MNIMNIIVFSCIFAVMFFVFTSTCIIFIVNLKNTKDLRLSLLLIFVMAIEILCLVYPIYIGLLPSADIIGLPIINLYCQRDFSKYVYKKVDNYMKSES